MKFITLLFSFWLVACNGQAQNVEGHYRLQDHTACVHPINITIKGKSFTIAEEISPNQPQVMSKGHVEVVKSGENTYLKMGKLEGLYEKDSITVQNEGNSMNEYIWFPSCGQKYLYFVKTGVDAE